MGLRYGLLNSARAGDVVIKSKLICVSSLVALVLGLTAPSASAGYASHVDLFAGTEPGRGTYGEGNNFPGATVPFGMVQWGPDTTPDQHQAAGYDYRDRHLKGFSLTHLDGAGCSLYGDFPFLPTTAQLVSSPAVAGSSALSGAFQPGFSHAKERARPGYYSLRLNPGHGAGIQTELTATTRTGLARFTFPSSPHSSVLINAGGSANPDDFASVQIKPQSNEISGSASSGLFCNQRPRYKVYFAAAFDRPFSAYGTWTRRQLSPGTTSATDTQSPASNPKTTAQAGAYATFDTSRNKVVMVRVGISFVSVENARANLVAEDPIGTFASVAARAERSWNNALGLIRVSDGEGSDVNMFYTALYHVFSSPHTFSDVNGQYIGMDGKLHNTGGRIQYADFSGWDIYRSEIQLLSILMPGRVDGMVDSLLADADQSGCLPRWPYANGQSMTQVGDSADPIIASAAAFGADHFHTATALAAMVKGATQLCQSENGSYVERQGLSDYESLGYVPYEIDAGIENADSIYHNPETVWASASTTLEYTTDDFAIAEFAARVLHESQAYRTFIHRSGTWRKLYDQSAGVIEPRYASGAFPTPYNPYEGSGFVEGDAYQYTWMVPQDPAGLFHEMGGRTKATRRLGFFLRKLSAKKNATHTSHALLGDEPNLNVPWLYDWTGRPYGTQEVVRRAILGLYNTSPSGYPGNDDLGTMSAWYVFGALGLYPEVPGVGLLAIGSPLFPRAVISLPDHKKTSITTRAYTFISSKSRKRGAGKPRLRKIALATTSAPYIQTLRFNGRSYGRPWTTYCALASGAHLSYQLGPRPNRRWGSSVGALPPSFGPSSSMPADLCTP